MRLTLNPQTLRSRVIALKSRHAALDDRIRDELSRPVPDGLRVQTLKRMRLKAKDQIAMIGRLLDRGGPQAPSAA